MHKKIGDCLTVLHNGEVVVDKEKNQGLDIETEIKTLLNFDKKHYEI
jgi:ABC-type uncharacterized transport system ATPase component